MSGQIGLRVVEFPVEQVGVLVRSDLNRMVDRLSRGKKDHDTVARWVLRGARRLGAIPVDDPVLRYRAMDDSGPRGQWAAKVSVIVPNTDEERARLTGIRLPSHVRIFRLPLLEPYPMAALSESQP